MPRTQAERRAISRGVRKAWADPATRERMREAQREAWRKRRELLERAAEIVAAHDAGRDEVQP